MSAMNTLTLTQNAGHLKSGWLILMVAVLSWPLASWGTTTTTLSGKVIHIVDGDTFDVLDAAREKHRIRVSCMDTPEKGQAFYRRAKDALADLIAGRDVIVQSYKKDRYGRLVGEVVGIDLCLRMIESGMAWHNLPYARELAPGRASILVEAEQGAQSRHDGLWADSSPQPPWELRRQQRESHR